MKTQKFKHVRTGQEIEAVRVTNTAEIQEVRDDEEWHGGQVRLLRYPTAGLIMFIGDTPPLSLFGRELKLGQWVARGPAGDVEPIPNNVVDGVDLPYEYEEVAA